jgi:ATP-binding cassette, subfamily B, bacterial
MGMFQGLATERYDRQYSDRQLVGRMARYFAPQRKLMARLAIAVLSVTALGLAEPLLMSRGLQWATETKSIDVILGLAAALLLTEVLNWLFARYRRRTSARLIAEIVGRMRQDAFAATVRHDMAFFDEFQSGKVISRITSDTQELAQVTTLIFDLISQFTTLLVLLVVLASISTSLTLALLAMAPVVVAFGYGFRRVARMVTRGGFRVLAEVNSAIQEAVAGMRVAKNFRQEGAIYRRFSEINGRAYSINVRRGFVLSTVFPTMNALGGVGTGIMTYFGGRAVLAGSIGIGSWYLFIVSLDQFWFPMSNIASFWSQIQNGLSACERIFALIDAEPNVKQLPAVEQKTADGGQKTEAGQQSAANGQGGGVRPLSSGLRSPSAGLKGAVDFDKVWFRYNAQQQVLQEFTLSIKPGESVALVGHTGAGKSSIIKLITRFYEFQAGQIRVDGHDIRTFDLTAYRRHLGLVSQSPFLFNDTVLNNIRYAVPDMSDADVERISRRIGAGEWVDALPHGLQTKVGERGGQLSLGQRQLVALARVLAQKPAIFILDEATASIDPFTERQIQDALKQILSDSTSILIAHRLSTVKAADRIIVLEKGAIIEEGNHDGLMARGGHYASLYDTYFRHQSADFNAELFQKRVTVA